MIATKAQARKLYGKYGTAGSMIPRALVKPFENSRLEDYLNELFSENGVHLDRTPIRRGRRWFHTVQGPEELARELLDTMADEQYADVVEFAMRAGDIDLYEPDIVRRAWQLYEAEHPAAQR